MNNTQTDVRALLKGMSPRDFLRIGMDEVAYIRPFKTPNSNAGFAIYAADGTQLSVLESMDMAMATLHHNDLIPVTLH
jgi:hypothetical protein